MKSCVVKKAILSATLACATFLTGCATTQVLQPVSPPGGDKAVVYFIRKSYPPYIHEVRLIANGNMLATISDDDFVAVNLPVGNNSIQVDVTDGKPLHFNMPVERPDRMYVVLTGDVTKVGQAITGYNQFTVYLQWSLRATPVSRAEAEATVSQFGRRLN